MKTTPKETIFFIKHTHSMNSDIHNIITHRGYLEEEYMIRTGRVRRLLLRKYKSREHRKRFIRREIQDKNHFEGVQNVFPPKFKKLWKRD